MKVVIFIVSFTDNHYNKYRNLIHSQFGIRLNDSKREMLKSKLSKLMRSEGIDSYDKYYKLLIDNKNSEQWMRFIDLITIHKTDFFRENNHFSFIRNNIETIKKNNLRIANDKKIIVWSAGCSTGEEPYTIAMVLKETLTADFEIKILATDISKGSVANAQRGFYKKNVIQDIDNYYLGKYFNHDSAGYYVMDQIKNMITFRTFNLMEPFPFTKKFDIIFCRNVMIYFDLATQAVLIKKFYEALNPGGMLFIGHSESLTSKQYKFKYVQPTVYLKPH